MAYWKDGSIVRFVYQHGTGSWGTNQWSEYGAVGSSWNKIGAEGVSSKFIGDAKQYYNLGNGWSYYYNQEKDLAYWKDGSIVRFVYQHGTGSWGTNQWWDYDSKYRWKHLGDSGVSSAFVGDRQYHDLGLHDGHWYQYWGGSSYYAVANGPKYLDKFRYNYSDGQWRYSITNWYNLGNSGQSSQFFQVGMGDVGLRWTFAPEIKPSSFDFNPDNTINAFIKYSTSESAAPDKILYFDDAGHKVAEGFIHYGSIGSRVVVDKSYVGMSDNWDGTYGSNYNHLWHTPLFTVFDKNGNMIIKHSMVSHLEQGDDYRYTDCRDEQVWIWEDSNGNGRYDANSSFSGDHIIHWREQKGGTCAIFTAMNITESVKGNGPNPVSFPDSFPDHVIRFYYPDYDPEKDRNGDFGAWPSAYLVDQQGFQETSSWLKNWADLVTQVENGKLAAACIAAYEIWAYNFPEYDKNGTPRDADGDFYLDEDYVPNKDGDIDYNHAIWVRGFHRDTLGNITHVIIADSGPGAGAGAFARVPVQHFQRAYEAADFYDPPSGWAWTNAGINTWKFNPVLYYFDSKNWQ